MAKRPVESPDVIEIAEKQRHLYLLQRVKNNDTLSSAELAELTRLDKKHSTPAAKAAPAKPDNGISKEVIKSQREAAQFASVTVRTIRRWQDEGMPRTPEGFYFRPVLTWWRDFKQGTMTDLKEQSLQVQLELKKTMAGLARLELEAKLDAYVRRAEVQKDNVRKVLDLKRGLKNMGRKISARYPIAIRRQLHAHIDAEVNRIIRSFAQASNVKDGK